MYRFIDLPRRRRRSDYAQATERFVEQVSVRPGVVSIYQLGGVSDPGISDLDFLIVTEDRTPWSYPRAEQVSGVDDYLLVHAPYGVSKADLDAAMRHSCFHDLRALWGPGQLPGAHRSPEEDRALEQQIGLEYLFRMYVSMTLQRAYGVFKLRGFFLHVHAIRYDLEFLGVESGEMVDLTAKLVTWRRSWFDRPVAQGLLSDALDRFHGVLAEFLSAQLAKQPLCLPALRSYHLAPNLELSPGEELRSRRRGLILPAALSVLGKRAFSLQNRLNRFRFECPVRIAPKGIVAERFRVLDRLRAYNQQYLSDLMILSSSLNLT